MNRIIAIILLVVCGVFSQLARAQEPAPKYPQRFLFVIETSADMKRLAPTTRQSVNELVKSGLGGYMEDGDTLGVWTFNDELTAGKLPMQVWSKTNAPQIAKKIEDLLKKTTFDSELQYQAVLPPLSSVIRSSPSLSIIFITSGTTPVFGTPFDKEINAYYDDNLKVSQKQKIPFLTMFLAQEGRLVRHSISPAIGDVKILKPLPPIVKPVQTNTVAAIKKEKPKAAPAEPEPSVVSTNTRGLVISGKTIKEVDAKDLPQKLQQPVFEKPEPLHPAPEAQPAPPINATAIETVAPSASTPVPAEPTPAAGAISETKATEQPPARANSQSAPGTTPQPVAPAEAAATVTTKAVEHPVDSTAPIEAKPTPEAIVQTPAPAPSLTQTPPPAPTVVPEPPKVSPAPQPTATATELPKPTKPEVTTSTAPVQTAALTSQIAGEHSKVNESISTEATPAAKGNVSAPAETATSAATVATVPVNVVPPANNSRWLLIVGLALVLIAVAIAYFLGKQSAKRSGPSLITDSFDRTKK